MNRVKIASLFLLSFFLFGLPSKAALAAADTIVPEEVVSVSIDGGIQKYDPPAMVVKDRTLVPLRAIFENLGANVLWDQETSTVTATKGSTTVTLKIGSNSATINGKTVTLDVPAALYHERTMVPARFVSEAFGYGVEWDGSKKQVKIQSGNHRLLSVEEVAKQADSVVQIEVYQNNRKIASGSGFVVSSDGDIVTNAHVIDGADALGVRFTNGDYVMVDTTQNVDLEHDLALIKVQKANVSYVKIGDSSKLQLGEQVVAIGSPLGLQNTLSTGVVSNKSRIISGHEFIQVTAPIDHGSSGGALFNMYGDVVGVTSAKIESSANLNLAIPSTTLKTFLDQPRTSKKLVPVASNTQSGTQKSTASEVQSYLNSNWGTGEYNGQTFHFNFSVSDSDDGSTQIVLNNMYNYSEISSLLDLGDNDVTVLYGLLLAIADDVYLKTGKNVAVGLFANGESYTYPTGIPASHVNYSNGKYKFYLTVVTGVFDYNKGQVSFVIGEDGKPVNLPLDKPVQ